MKNFSYVVYIYKEQVVGVLHFKPTVAMEKTLFHRVLKVVFIDIETIHFMLISTKGSSGCEKVYFFKSLCLSIIVTGKNYKSQKVRIFLV